MSSRPNSLNEAAFLMLFTRVCVKALGLISSLILVRILTPEDFGLIAIAMSIYAFIEIFGLFGFNNAIIHKKNPSKADYDSAFTASLIFGLLAASTLFLLSAYISQFYEDARLEFVLKSISLMFVLNGCVNIRILDFQKNMNFKKELYYQLLPKLITFFVTLYSAYLLQSYVALIIGMLVNSSAILIISYIMKPYVPIITLKGMSELFSYSKWLMMNSILYYLNNSSLNLIVGKFISTRAAGLYSLSNEIASLPLSEIAAPINKASFPAYSKVQGEFNKLKKHFIETTSLIAIISLPASAGLIAVVEPFVAVVLGEQWYDAAPVIEYIALVSFIAAIGTNIGYIFMAIGLPKITFFVSLIRTIVFFLLLVFFASKENIESVALVMFLATVISTCISFIILQKTTAIRFSSVLYSLRMSVPSTLVMALLVMVTITIIEQSQYASVVSLCIGISIGLITYPILIYLFWLLWQKPEGIEKKLLKRLKVTVNNVFF